MSYTTVPCIRDLLPLAIGVLALLHAANVGAYAPGVPSPRERSQVLLDEGDTALERGDVGEAIAKYQASYYSLPSETRTSHMGTMAVRNAMQAYEQRVAAETDSGLRRRILERQRGFLREFLDELADRDDTASKVDVEAIAELRAMLRKLDEVLVEPSQPAEATRAKDVGIEAVAEPQREWLGLGLVIGGAALVGTGMGVCAGWWTIRKQALVEVDGAGGRYAPGTNDRAEYLAEETAKARTFLLAGSVVAGIGLAVAIDGAVRMGLHRRKARQVLAMDVAPWLGPTNLGIAARRHF